MGTRALYYLGDKRLMLVRRELDDPGAYETHKAARIKKFGPRNYVEVRYQPEVAGFLPHIVDLRPGWSAQDLLDDYFRTNLDVNKWLGN